MDWNRILDGIILIKTTDLIVYHYTLDTVVILRIKPFIALIIQLFVILLLLSMQRRSVVEYLVSQPIMVIIYICVMKELVRFIDIDILH